jgi:ferrochelatase
MAALSALAIQHMQGWPTGVAPNLEAREAQRRRALAAGATA